MKNNITQTIESVGRTHIEGNITPPIWYRRIKSPKGRTDHIAVALLADVWAFYRPQYVRDEESSEITEVKRRFRADKLQRSYAQIAEMFDCSKDNAKDAVNLLVHMGVLTREFRGINTGEMYLSNVMFLEPVVDAVLTLTYENNQKPDKPDPIFYTGYPQRRKRKIKPGYVYLLKSNDGYYKIGKSTNAAKRIGRLGVTLPFEIEPIHIVNTQDMDGLERTLHQRFEQKRVRGEWFSLSQDDIHFIRSVGQQPCQ